MFWPIAHDQQTTETKAMILLEGTVAFHYDAFIPGVQPRMVGTHWLLKDECILQTNAIGTAIQQRFPHQGFWTLSGALNVPIGTRIRATLVRHVNSEGYLTLMPLSCSHYAVSSDDGKPLLYMPLTADDAYPITDQPVKFLFMYSLSGDEDEINAYEIYFGNSFSILQSAWQGTPRLQWNDVGKYPPPVPTHCVPSIVPHIPPHNPGEDEPIGHTERPHGRAVNVNDRVVISINKNYPLAVSPNAEQYDFTFILAHEMGHLVGMVHIPDSTDCLMMTSGGAGPLSHVLCARDIAQLHALYGA